MIGYSAFNINNTFNLYIITEFMSRGSLARVLSQDTCLSYRRRLDIAADIACGMARIHDKNFIHRDIRPDNILISYDYVAKIGDMGIAKEIVDKNNSMIGYNPFMPPEFFKGKYDKKLDIFTFGLTLNELFEGKNYPHNNNSSKIKEMGKFFEFIIKPCTDYNPDMRPTTEIVEINLKIFQKVIIAIIANILPNYTSYSLNKRNAAFKFFYDTILEKCFNNELLINN